MVILVERRERYLRCFWENRRRKEKRHEPRVSANFWNERKCVEILLEERGGVSAADEEHGKKKKKKRMCNYF